MKIIKLFLLSICMLLADFQLDMPAIKSNVVEDVIKYGWEKADDNLKILFKTKGIKFLNDLKILATKPLKEQSDDEYLREHILKFSEPSFIEPEEYGLPPKVTEEEHLRLLKLTIKYDLKFMKYKRFFDRDTYSYMMAYIKLLENRKEFSKAYNLYILAMDRLLYIDKTVDRTMINHVYKIISNEVLKDSLKESFSHKYYSKEQMSNLLNKLKVILMFNEDYWEQMMLEEKRQSLAYMRITVIDVKTFEEFLQKYNAEFEKEMFEDLDKKTLKKFFEDKEVMEKTLAVFENKINEVLDKLKLVKNYNEYLALEKQYKNEVFIYGEKLLKKIGKGNKYRFTKEEFTEVVGEAMFAYRKSWKIGKRKLDFLETLEQNKKFLKTLKVYK